jgi:hypothetical protein
MSDALPCPKCGCWAQESRGLGVLAGRQYMSGYFWHCSNDPEVPIDGAEDCEFVGPEMRTSEEALTAWNALPRSPSKEGGSRG